MIYKIVRRREWDEGQSLGLFLGSPDDMRDRFLHFSTAAQLRATYEKHFAGEKDLLLLVMDEAAPGDVLRWDVSRGGEKFPHLYAPLPQPLAYQIGDLQIGPDGRPVFPPEIP